MRKHIRNRKSLRRQRGAAMVEFALVTPIFVTLLLWSMYFTELVRARLRLMESARFIAWEMTSYPITDFDTGNNDHDRYYEDARAEVVTNSTTRFQDLDSVDQRNGLPSMVMTASGYQARMQQMTVPPIAGQFAGMPGILSSVTSILSSGMNGALGIWGFNTKGKVQVDVEVSVSNKILPRSYNDQSVGQVQKEGVWGGGQLNNKVLKNKYVMIVNGWHLRDGADALMDKDHNDIQRAGGHDEDGEAHTLKVQTAKMSFLGATNFITNLPGFGQVYQFLSSWDIFPQFLGTYVTSYGFDHDSQTTPDNGCTGSDTPGNNNAGGISGYIDLSKASELDDPGMRCFNTAPFRDTQAFNGGESLYREMFEARGEFFMGCQNEQADDPTTATDPNGTDKANKANCGQ